MVTARLLDWEGCRNARDFGGQPIRGGGETAFRRLVRSDSVARLSDGGVAALQDYGVRTIVDLRLSGELEPDWPRTHGVTTVHAPFCREATPEEWAELDGVGLSAENEVEGTRTVYLEMLEQNRELVAAAVVAIAGAASNGTVLIHCHAGKDRTGMLSALLLDIAEVDRDSIAADYAHSRVALAGYLDAWIAGAPDEHERQRREWLSAAPAAAILGVLGDLDVRYGAPRGFLLDAGVDADALTLLRGLLRT